ncbi:uncharacterized protein [Periplaneta americana]|uniref:uncharacterized protein n=1 Tax=Periplaneta americana TaxID=6978 RepID=UPI0037E8B58A
MAKCATPSWLNNIFLETALRSGEVDPTIMVISSSIQPATASGDNYLSEMFRVTVKMTRGDHREERSLIVKVEPKKEQMLKIAEKGNIFDLEARVYRDVIPAMYRLLERSAPGEFQPFGARYFYSHKGMPATVVVLEDLKKLGFTMGDRTHGLNMDHCLLVMRTLARFHATSVVMHERDPDCFKPFMETIYRDEMKEHLGGFFISNVKNFAEEVRKWPDHSSLAEKIKNIGEHSMDYWTKAIQRDDEGFNVLSHGDLWLNNMMFRYSDDTGDVEDIRFVDFQLTYWTSPTVDLLYFLNSSPHIDIADKIDVCVEEYHKTLGETLAMFGYGHLHPSLDYLHKELQKRATFGVISGIAIRTVVMVDRTHIPDMDKVILGKEKVKFSESYKMVMEKLLPFYKDKGWL